MGNEHSKQPTGKGLNDRSLYFGSTPFHRACHNGDLATVTKYLQQGAIPDWDNLAAAAHRGHDRIVEALIVAGVSFSGWDFPAIAKRAPSRAAALLVYHGINVDSLSLVRAAADDNSLARVQFHIQSGAVLSTTVSPEKDIQFEREWEEKHRGTVCPGRYANDPFAIAFREGYIAILQALVKAGARFMHLVDLGGIPSCKEDELDYRISALLTTNPDHFSPTTKFKIELGWLGYSPVHTVAYEEKNWRGRPHTYYCGVDRDYFYADPGEAVEKGFYPVSCHRDILLKQGSKAHEQLLLNAAFEGNLTWLCAHASDPEAAQSSTRTWITPLWIACYTGNTDVARYLIKNPIGSPSTTEPTGTGGADEKQTVKRPPPSTPLGIAAQKGHLEVVRIFIEALSSNPERLGTIDDVDAHGNTPLWYAACWNREEVLAALLRAGADPNRANRYGESPLWIACYLGHEGIVRALIAADPALRDNEAGTSGQARLDVNQANPFWYYRDQSPLFIAAARGHTKIVALLLKAGAYARQADEAKRLPLHAACAAGHADIVSLLLNTEYDTTLLMAASQDDSGNNPLHLACKGGHVDAVNAFLENTGAQKRRGEALEQFNLLGRTPVDIACETHNLPVVLALLVHANEFDLNQPGGSSNETALFFAAFVELENPKGKKQHKQELDPIVQAVIRAGGNVDHQTYSGHTAIAYACLAKNAAAVAALLADGARLLAGKRGNRCLELLLTELLRVKNYPDEDKATLRCFLDAAATRERGPPSATPLLDGEEPLTLSGLSEALALAKNIFRDLSPEQVSLITFVQVLIAWLTNEGSTTIFADTLNYWFAQAPPEGELLAWMVEAAARPGTDPTILSLVSDYQKGQQSVSPAPSTSPPDGP